MAILETKTLAPPVPAHLVSRQRLLEKLDQALQRKLTLVSAPAGSGKTTLLSEWIAVRGRRLKSAWVSLGKEENDPYRFWNYFVGSINKLADKGFSDWLELSASPTADDLDTLINWIALNFHRDFVLVLDDYHLVSSAEISDALTYLLDYLPQVMHIAILSRSIPQLPTAQMRVRNQLLELTRDDLKFTQNEAETLFNQMTRKRFLSEEVAQVNDRAEGWAAGLQMAAMSVQASEQATLHDLLIAFTGTHHYLGDYFLEQVFCEQTVLYLSFMKFEGGLDHHPVECGLHSTSHRRSSHANCTDWEPGFASISERTDCICTRTMFSHPKTNSVYSRSMPGGRVGDGVGVSVGTWSLSAQAAFERRRDRTVV